MVDEARECEGRGVGHWVDGWGWGLGVGVARIDFRGGVAAGGGGGRGWDCQAPGRAESDSISDINSHAVSESCQTYIVKFDDMHAHSQR